jgi:predicted HD superfamily hydrolase involved in NAD metabolism
MTQRLIEKYKVKLENDDLKENIRSYFDWFNRIEVYNHTLEVVAEVQKLHQIYSFDLAQCEIAAYMHDLGRVVEPTDIVKFCEENGHVFKPGEREVPSILHQKASRIIGQQVFKIENEDILNAIGCHTTLKANPSEIDMIVFLSDKLSWTEAELNVLTEAMSVKAQTSKEEAIIHYLSHMHINRQKLKCYHQWSEEAYEYFTKK